MAQGVCQTTALKLYLHGVCAVQQARSAPGLQHEFLTRVSGANKQALHPSAASRGSEWPTLLQTHLDFC